MKAHLTRHLGRLGKLRVSAKFKTSVLASVISIQARRLRAQEVLLADVSRLLPQTSGRQAPELEPMGFAALPAHARPMVERYYQRGGPGHEHETSSAEVPQA